MSIITILPIGSFLLSIVAGVIDFQPSIMEAREYAKKHFYHLKELLE